MGLIKLTFNDCLNTAEHDASFNKFLIGDQNGVLKGLGGEVESRVENGAIVFEDGYIIGHGRRVYIEKGTRIDVDLNGKKKGRISIKIDAKSETAELVKNEIQVTSAPLELPSLSLSLESYECVLCHYEVGASLKITGGVGQLVESSNEILEKRIAELKAEMSSNQGGGLSRIVEIRGYDGGFYFPESNAENLKNGIVSFQIQDSIISVPMRVLMNGEFRFTYCAEGHLYKGTIEGRYGDRIFMVLDVYSHHIEHIYITY